MKVWGKTKEFWGISEHCSKDTGLNKNKESKHIGYNKINPD